MPTWMSHCPWACQCVFAAYKDVLLYSLTIRIRKLILINYYPLMLGPPFKFVSCPNGALYIAKESRVQDYALHLFVFSSHSVRCSSSALPWLSWHLFFFWRTQASYFVEGPSVLVLCYILLCYASLAWVLLKWCCVLLASYQLVYAFSFFSYWLRQICHIPIPWHNSFLFVINMHFVERYGKGPFFLQLLSMYVFRSVWTHGILRYSMGSPLLFIIALKHSQIWRVGALEYDPCILLTYLYYSLNTFTLWLNKMFQIYVVFSSPRI